LENLNGKRSLITGGATGIGRALAQQLATEGMQVVIASTSRERLDRAVDELRASGATASAIQCDVADRNAVRDMAAEAGPIDLLIANAGVTTAGPLHEHRDGDWDWVLDVTLRGVTNCIQAFYPAMAERGSGHIVLVGSQTAFAPDWALDHGPYTAAKAAVHAMAFALRAEAARHGIGVTLLVPAHTLTDVLEGDRSRQAKYGASCPGQVSIRKDAPAPLSDHPLSLSADEVARRAIAGIRANAAVVATHAGMKPLTQDYFDRILAAYDEAARFACATLCAGTNTARPRMDAV